MNGVKCRCVFTSFSVLKKLILLMKSIKTMTLYANVYYCENMNKPTLLRYKVVINKQNPNRAADTIVKYLNDCIICREQDDCQINVFDEQGNKLLCSNLNSPAIRSVCTYIKETQIDRFPFETE
ncbi:MAG: hypothetical protein [Bacteriophage sp.]|nr:MAG: hypothetical protein [Bacteriophage sp.]